MCVDVNSIPLEPLPARKPLGRCLVLRCQNYYLNMGRQPPPTTPIPLYSWMTDSYRQFLFREADIGKPKSLTAARAVSAMNPSLNIKPYEAKCAPETEELFSDDFYAGLSVRSAPLRRCVTVQTAYFCNRHQIAVFSCLGGLLYLFNRLNSKPPASKRRHYVCFSSRTICFCCSQGSVVVSAPYHVACATVDIQKRFLFFMAISSAALFVAAKRDRVGCRKCPFERLIAGVFAKSCRCVCVKRHRVMTNMPSSPMFWRALYFKYRIHKYRVWQPSNSHIQHLLRLIPNRQKTSLQKRKFRID